MLPADLPRVMLIEDEAFPTPWPERAYRDQLECNANCHCHVLEATKGRLCGYGCFWFVVDKAHISTLVVAQRWRGRGLGELLLLALIDQAIAKNAALVTLEVRGSNKTAQALYTKYGLKVVGRRKLYYADNQEDALIMTVKLLGGGYQARLAQLQAALFARLAAGE